MYNYKSIKCHVFNRTVSKGHVDCLCIKDCLYSCGSFFQDESHFLKNIKTARCRAAVPILKVSVAERDLGP